MDKLTKEQRQKNMQANKSSETNLNFCWLKILLFLSKEIE